MIPGTKSFLKKILQADYNANVEVEEPKKPNSLNLFLKFRKEMMNSVPLYKNLPPQEGLYDPDPEEERIRKLQEKAKRLQQNSDFKILDADQDPAAAKASSFNSLDEEDEAMDVMEQNMIKRHGEIYKQKSRDVFGDHEMVQWVSSVRLGKRQDAQG